MDKPWIKIYTTNDFLKAELLRQALEENEIEVVILNKKDSSYQFGEVQVLVPEDQASQAKEFITLHNI